MKKIVTLLLTLFCVSISIAQKVGTDKMQSDGLSSQNTKAQYLLGLIRNEDTKRLREMFEKEPWLIQADINVYKDATQNASVSLFCVAVDLGNTDVVQAFLDYGYGKKDFCNVTTYTEKQVIVSKVDMVSKFRTYGETSNSSQTTQKGWFRSNSSSSSSSSSGGISEDTHYTRVDYKDKVYVASYFAYPLDFATDKMFDFLWSKGFRSNNLFTKFALLEAKETGKREVFNYIMKNKPEVLADKPEVIEESFYRELLKTAAKNPNSIAFEALEKGTLKEYASAQEAQKAEQKLDDMLNKHLKNKKGIVASDTLGYAGMKKAAIDQEKALLGKSQYKLSLEELKRYIQIGGTVDVKDINAAIDQNDLEKVMYLIEYGVKPNNESLNKAIKAGNIDIVKYFIEEMEIQPTEADLNAAVANNNLELIKYLSQYKFVPDAGAVQNAIMEAIRRDDVELVKYYMANYEEMFTDEHLIRAFTHDRYDFSPKVASYFLEEVINPNAALDLVLKKGDLYVISNGLSFILKHGAKPNSEHLNLALRKRGSRRRDDYYYIVDIVETLLENGAKPDKSACKKMHTYEEGSTMRELYEKYC